MAVLVVRLERKAEAVVERMDHLEDLGNIGAFDSLPEAPLDVENAVFPVESVIKTSTLMICGQLNCQDASRLAIMKV